MQTTLKQRMALMARRIALLDAMVIAVLLLGMATTSAIAAKKQAPTPAAAPADSAQLFEPIRSVIQSPRCVNCHVADGVPRQFDDSRPHAQNVHGGADGKGVTGLACSTCHYTQNPAAASGPHAPPGAPNWHLAPIEMVWYDVGARDICLRLRDPRHNGGRDPAALVHHFADDPLVGWGWQPGGARSLPPLTRPQTVAAVQAWIAADMPCPLQ
ncbi:MAG: hypothetical protein JWR16_2365 [Nevskia sp.]|nr:hypothetical protein [Nevskia sp.]